MNASKTIICMFDIYYIEQVDILNRGSMLELGRNVILSRPKAES